MRRNGCDLLRSIDALGACRNFATLPPYYRAGCHTKCGMEGVVFQSKCPTFQVRIVSTQMTHFLMLLALFAATFAVIGCDRDVAEMETPAGTEVEVESDVTTGALETEVDD